MSFRRIIVFVVAILHYNVMIKAQDQIQFDKSDQEAQTGAAGNFKCGVNNPGGLIYRFQDGKDRIDADYGEFSWMVAIISKTDKSTDVWSQTDYLGGGSIIHPSVVITSTHIIANKEAVELTGRAGEWNTSSGDEQYLHQDRDVRKIVNHHDYIKESFHNSVSLLFMVKPYNYASAPQIGPVCVGQATPAAGTDCYISGWGSSTTVNTILQKVQLKLLSEQDCETKIRETKLGESFMLHSSLTCADNTGDSCDVEGGAPLVCPVASEGMRYVLYGMSAYHVEQKGAPCVFVKVSQFYEWVGQRMAEEGLNSDSYTYQPVTS